MADRYWVGGDGIWDDTSTANWSDTTGGTPGASVPTASDNVFFDINSHSTDYTVTMDGDVFCRDFVMDAPASGNVIWDSTFSAILQSSGTYRGNWTSSLYISGSLDLLGGSAGITKLHGSRIYMVATDTGHIINLNGVLLGQNSKNRIDPDLGVLVDVFAGADLILNGVGGEWTFTSAVTFDSIFGIQLINGSLITDGFSYSAYKFHSIGTGTRTLDIRNSTFLITNSATQRGWYIVSDNLTFLSDTSKIRYSDTGGPVFNARQVMGNNLVYDQIEYASTSLTGSVEFLGSGVSINEVIVTGNPSNQSAPHLIFDSGETWQINTLTVNNTTPLSRISISSRSNAVPGTIENQTTLEINNITTGACIDFRNVAVTGPLSPLNQGTYGDKGYNSGITFPIAKTVYLVGELGSDSYFYSNHWSLTSGGTVDSAVSPLPHDRIIVDDNTISSRIVIRQNQSIPNIDFSSRSTEFTFTIPDDYGNYYLYGDFISNSNIIYDIDFNATFSNIRNRLYIISKNNMELTLGSNAFYIEINISNDPNSTLTLGSELKTVPDNPNLVLGAYVGIFHYTGSFDTNGYPVTTEYYQRISNPALIMTSDWEITGRSLSTFSTSPIWETSGISNIQYNNARLIFSGRHGNNSATAKTIGSSFPNEIISTGFGYLYLYDGGMEFGKITSNTDVIFRTGTTTVQDWNINGEPGSPITVSGPLSSQATIQNTSGGIFNSDYVIMKNMSIAPASSGELGLNSTNGGRNNRWIFLRDKGAASLFL